MQEFDLITCYKCGVGFAIPHYLNVKLKENSESFFCPNGHSQAYTVSMVAQLQKELAAANQATALEKRQKEQAEVRAWKLELKSRKLAKRISAGVCPCCNRQFQDMKRHMETKHKDYALPPAPEQKQIEAAS